MEFQVPDLKFKFKAGRPAGKGRRIRILPVFSEQKAADVAALLDQKDLADALSAYYDTASFKGSASQILNLADRDLILAGLGASKDFHPEKWAALFRSLGERLARFKDCHFELILSEPLADAVEAYSSGDEPGDRLTLDLKKKTNRPAKKATARDAKAASKKSASKKVASSGKGGGESGEDEDAGDSGSDHDYSGPYSVEELISQVVACAEIGAESMELLKTKGKGGAGSDVGGKSGKVASKQSPVLEIGVTAAGLKADRVQAALDRGAHTARSLHGSRYIAGLPGNYMHPELYEAYARKVAKDHGLQIKVFNAQQLEKMGAGGILAVGKGSAIPPRMIALEYKPSKTKITRPLVLVGKGITFDTGGISLKPPAEMHEMKYDMCGSALALHTITLAAARKLPIEVVCLLGIAENMPDGLAIKPGDVYTALNGLTVEVQNTDAEGRLVLGDVLSYACREYDPLCITDFATLTGAAIIALGHDAAALMTSSDDLAERYTMASRQSLDRLWRLPHWAVYGGGLKSEVADLRNIGGRPAGTVTAMRFLSRFVEDSVPWAHIDIAGVAWRGKAQGGQTSKGATGWGVRLMQQFMEDLVGEAE